MLYTAGWGKLIAHMARRGAFRLILALAALFVFIVLPTTVDFLMDWLWFSAIGYRNVFTTSLRAQASLGTFVFAAAFAVLFGNLWIAVSSIANPYIVLGTSGGTVQPTVVGREQLRRVTGVACLVVSLIMGLVAGSEWLRWLQFWHGAPFRVVDPILGHDVSFYVFRLPLLELADQLAMTLLIFSFIGAAAAYVLAGALNFTKRGGVSVGAKARWHLSLLAAGCFAALAYHVYLDIPHLLTTTAGPGTVHGASYADVMARLPALRVLVAVTSAGALLAAYNAFSRAFWPLPVALFLYLVTSVGGSAYAAAVQRFVVSPNEQTAETPYMAYNIEATRRAFNLANVQTRELSGDAELTRADIEANADTIKNVRLWDHQPLLDTFGQIQELRTYYDFASVDNDRYSINGELRQVMLSARELNSESLPNRTWINEHLTFTHGYGLTLGPVNEVTQEGLPVLFVKDIPPQSTVPNDIDIKEPGIYFGELSNDYVLVDTNAKEFHYSRGEDNVGTRYTGADGVKIGGLLNKLLFSLGFQSFQILFSNDITPESRILYHRNINDRVKTIANFLHYDDDPYMVESGGRLFWIRDAYTTTDQYPYSTPAASGLNYIRNSVKVVIDAYNGTTDYYLADPADPIALTLANIFPGFLKPMEAMPPDLRKHVRYPETIFALQASMYSTYHMTNPVMFYNKEDQWEIPAIDTDGNPRAMQPYYTVMRIPGESRAEFIQMLPFTPQRKDNLAAWMVARSDPEHYGQLQVFQFPKQKVVFGPRQIVARISQDQEISPQITLWNQQGSQVIQGTLLVIPIKESLLYVRPLYLRASNGKIPELKRVIVAYQNQIVMASTLENALDRIFGAGRTPSARTDRDSFSAASLGKDPRSVFAPQSDDPSAASQALLAGQAREHYQHAMQAQHDGNWALYGEEIRSLGQTLKQMAK
ncbi:MAG: UPF0182 family protein [Acidobacteria bacterium]|nr:UPF0182 family protein [Acidobacteriota bacterium]